MVYSIKVDSKNAFKISVGFFFFLFVQINQILLTFLLILLGFGGADMLILLYLISASHARHLIPVFMLSSVSCTYSPKQHNKRTVNQFTMNFTLSRYGQSIFPIMLNFIFKCDS